MRLTYASLGTFLKYPWLSASQTAVERRKFGALYADEQTLKSIVDALCIPEVSNGIWARHPLAYLVEAADDICYALLDLEDGDEIGLLPYEKVNELFVNMGGAPIPGDDMTNTDSRRKLSLLRGGAINNLVNEIADAFTDSEPQIRQAKFKGTLLEECRGGDFVKQAKLLSEKSVFDHPRKIQLEIGAYATMDVLLTAFCDAALELKRKGNIDQVSFKSKRLLDLMKSNKMQPSWTMYRLLIRTVDYITGMTDNYATYIANQIVGMAK